MPSDVLVRATRPGDWACIWPFWHDIVARGDTFCYDPATTEADARASWFDDVDNHPAVAEMDDRVVGAAVWSANRAGPGGHIATGSYMVDAAARGRGAGRALVLHTLRGAADAAFRGMQFNAVAATNVGAVRLYESLGFVTLGVVPGGFRHPVHGDVGLLTMYHDLSGIPAGRA